MLQDSLLPQPPKAPPADPHVCLYLLLPTFRRACCCTSVCTCCCELFHKALLPTPSAPTPTQPSTSHMFVLAAATSQGFVPRSKRCITPTPPPACPTEPEGPPAGSVRLAGARVDALHEARPQGGRPHAGRPTGDRAHAQLHRHDGALQGVGCVKCLLIGAVVNTGARVRCSSLLLH